MEPRRDSRRQERLEYPLKDTAAHSHRPKVFPKLRSPDHRSTLVQLRQRWDEK